MSVLVRAGMLAALTAGMIGLNTGCSNSKMKADRDNLLRQNQELQAENAAHQKEMDAANSKPIEAAPAATEAAPATAPAMAENTDTSSDNGGETVAAAGKGTDVVQGTNKYGETTLTIASDVLFDTGKATLKPKAKRSLQKAIGILRRQHAGADLRVEGYTDSTPVKHSTWDDNWDLGASRARTVALYLIANGIPKSHISIVSHGDNDLRTSKAASRRVEIVVVR